MDVREKLVELLAPTSLNFEEATYLADYLVKNGVTVQEWIPVDERLPQEGGAVCKNVILFMDGGLVTVGWLNQITNRGYYLDTINDVIIKAPLSRFTHWMPLPQPPKGE